MRTSCGLLVANLGSTDEIVVSRFRLQTYRVRMFAVVRQVRANVDSRCLSIQNSRAISIYHMIDRLQVHRRCKGIVYWLCVPRYIQKEARVIIHPSLTTHWHRAIFSSSVPPIISRDNIYRILASSLRLVGFLGRHTHRADNGWFVGTNAGFELCPFVTDSGGCYQQLLPLFPDLTLIYDVSGIFAVRWRFVTRIAELPLQDWGIFFSSFPVSFCDTNRDVRYCV